MFKKQFGLTLNALTFTGKTIFISMINVVELTPIMQSICLAKLFSVFFWTSNFIKIFSSWNFQTNNFRVLLWFAGGASPGEGFQLIIFELSELKINKHFKIIILTETLILFIWLDINYQEWKFGKSTTRRPSFCL